MNIPKVHSQIDSAAAQAKKGATAVNDGATVLGLALERAESARELAKKAKQAVHDATDE